MTRSCKGFSLLELIMVMAVLALAVALLMPRWQRAGEHGLRAQAQILREAMDKAKLEAMASGESQHFRWNPGTREWQTAQTSGKIPDDIEVSLTFGQERRAATLDPKIDFSPDGLSTGGRLILQRDGQTQQLDIDWLSGQVQLSAGSP